MKLSIAWIFDHIDADWHTQDILKLINLFNQKTAEVEGFYKITLDLDNLFLGQVISVAQKTVQLEVPETKQTVELAKRDDIKADQWFMLKRNGSKWRWAMGKDFYNDNVVELPAVFCEQKLYAGEWKQHIDREDYILEVDNKSITHRPDLWCHRGFAREVAILLNLPFKPLGSIIASLPINQFATESKASNEQPFAVRIGQTDLIKRFAIAYFNSIENRPTLPWMASRLCRVESKPIDALVDITNYVMLDVGQPLHAFDAQKIENRFFEPRLAKAKETVTLLDDETIELTDEDIVITDGKKPIALGGIMGGKDTAVSLKTNSILLESANFDATTIRKTANRYKKRTESAVRFEKTLDPNRNVVGIQRFVKLLDDVGIPYEVSAITSVGPETNALNIAITHTYIEERLGVSIDSKELIAFLEALGCTVETNKSDEQLVYYVTVPTLRSTKDVQIKEDLLEEIGRLYGYTNIPFVLPRKETKPSNLEMLNRQRHIKRLLSFGFQMREVKNYAFYNQSFLSELQWHPHGTVSIKNPVSEQYQQLVTSLIPGLLSNIKENHVDHDQLRFFEWGRVWSKDSSNIYERSACAAVFYNKKEPISFYELKSYMEHLLAMIRLPVTWHKVNEPEEIWFAPYQSAYIKHNDTLMGTVGVIDVGFTHKLFAGHAAAFSLNGTFLDELKPKQIAYHAVSKYPAIDRDISMMIASVVTVDQIKQKIISCSPLITQVSMIDHFQKPEWEDKKSLAFRFVIQDAKRTLTHQEADAISAAVSQAVQSLGAQIR